MFKSFFSNLVIYSVIKIMFFCSKKGKGAGDVISTSSSNLIPTIRFNHFLSKASSDNLAPGKII
jgi:hypothetical protein